MALGSIPAHAFLACTGTIVPVRFIAISPPPTESFKFEHLLCSVIVEKCLGVHRFSGKIRMISVHGLVLFEYSYSKDFVQNWTSLSYIRPSFDSPPLVACYNLRSKSAFSHSIQMGSSSFDTNDAEMSYSCLEVRSFSVQKNHRLHLASL